MGKIEDMRRQREQQWQEAQERAKRMAKSAVAPPPSDPAPPPRPKLGPETLKPRTLGSDEGRCSGCGKVRALKGGLIVSHRKGLNEMCPGSRKEPV